MSQGKPVTRAYEKPRQDAMAGACFPTTRREFVKERRDRRGCSSARPGRRVRRCRRDGGYYTSRLHVVIEVVFGADAPAHAEDVGGTGLRIQFHVVARTVPEIAGVAQEIVRLVRLFVAEAEFLDR